LRVGHVEVERHVGADLRRRGGLASTQAAGDGLAVLDDGAAGEVAAALVGTRGVAVHFSLVVDAGVGSEAAGLRVALEDRVAFVRRAARVGARRPAVVVHGRISLADAIARVVSRSS